MADVCDRTDPQLEFFYPAHKGEHCLHPAADPVRSKRHADEHKILVRIFFPEIEHGYAIKGREKSRERSRVWYAQHKDRVNAERREKCARERVAAGKPAQRYPELTPPCGGDCENCPYPDEPCRYEGWDQSKARQQARRRRAWQKLKADPQRLAEHNAKRRERHAKDLEAAGKIPRRRLTTICGADCENCPYPDEPCRYEGWDPQKARRVEYQRRRWREIKSDPQRLAEYNAKARGYKKAAKTKEGQSNARRASNRQ